MDNSRSEMLKPFRIRDLGEDPSSVGETGRGVRDGIVQLSAPDYDTTISKHPEATLMYMDDDDGEIVSVGSSFELGQRLDEPVKIHHRHTSRQPLRQGILTPPALSYMHIFDINRTNTALSVWKEFEKKDRGLSAALQNLQGSWLEPNATMKSKESDSDLKVHVDASDDAVRLKELEDERQRWFWACNPPRMIPVQALASNPHTTSDIPVTNVANASMPSEAVSKSAPQSPPLFETMVTPHPSSLTSEAKKQAQDAAAKFRGWKNPAIADAKVSSRFQNRWASYNQDGSFSSPDPRILSTNPDHRLPATKATHICNVLNGNGDPCGHLCWGRADLLRHVRTHERRERHNNRDEFFQRRAPIASASSSTVSPLKYEPPRVENEPPQFTAIPPELPALPPGATLIQGEEALSLMKKFDTELAKIMATPIVRPTETKLGNESSGEPSKNEYAPPIVQPTAINPGEVLVNTIQSLIDGIGFLGVELKNAFPDIQRNIFSAQEQLPGHVDDAVRGALHGFGTQMGNLATSMHKASEVTRQAAERTREADLRAVEGAAEGLRGFVEGVGEMGKTLFSAFEAELSPPVNSDSQDQPILAQTISDEEKSAPTPQSAEQEIREDSEGLNVVAQKPKLVAPAIAPKEVPSEGARINATSYNQHRRIHRNMQLHRHHIPLESQDSQFNIEDGSRSGRSPVTEEAKPELARDGRSRSPPRRSRPFDSQRSGHFHHEGPPHFPHPGLPHFHHGGPPHLHPPPPPPPPFYPRFPFSIGTSAHPMPPHHQPEGMADGHPGAPPGVPLHPWSRPPPPPGHFHPSVRHRRSWYPGFRPDHHMSERMSKPSVVSTDTIKQPEANKAETSGTNQARRIRSVGWLSAQLDTPHTTRDAPQQTNNSSAILDQDLADPAFSVRYPSLVANSNLRRSNTTLGRPPVSLDDSEMVRFPTLSQFEEQAHKDHLESGSNTRADDTTQSIPGSWPPPADLPTGESSGEFFTRMTGLRATSTEEPISRPKNQLSRSKTTTASNPAARLLGPFDPLGSFKSSQQDEGLKRSVTDRGPHRRTFDGNRRPYSEHFSGDGRQGWESFLQQYEKTPGSFPTQDDTESQRQYPTLPKFEPTRNVTHSGRARPQRPVLKVDTTHPKPGPKPRLRQKTKNERCMDQLKMLGFGTEQDGGDERLMIYAEGADGNLEDAIEMIEEERKAYQQRSEI